MSALVTRSPDPRVGEVHLDVGFEPHVLLQAAYDRLWAEAGGLRRDVYVERSVSEALDLGHHAGLVAYQRAGSAPGDPLLLQWAEFAPGRIAARWPGRVLAQADATRDEAVEFAVGWAREFGGRKANHGARAALESRA